MNRRKFLTGGAGLSSLLTTAAAADTGSRPNIVLILADDFGYGSLSNPVDMMATLSALAGRPLPPPDAGAEDSVNVLPAFLGKKSSRPLRDSMISHSADGILPYVKAHGNPSSVSPASSGCRPRAKPKPRRSFTICATIPPSRRI